MKKQNKNIKIAVMQFASEDGEVQKNFRTLKALLEKLKHRPDLIVLPEMWPSGLRVLEGETLLSQTQKVLEEMAQIVRSWNTYIVGSHLSRGKGGFYNTAAVMNPHGKIISNYHKVHLFQMGGERKKFLPGNKAQVVKTKIGNLGLSICYDIRFPELIRKEVLQGAELLLIPAAWPRVRIEHYRTLLRARAIENQCFVISANRIGKNADGIEYGGHSVVIDPWGIRLGELKGKAGILEVKIDLNQVKKIRKSFPVFEARREEIY